MYFYRQSLDKHFQYIHSYLPPNSYPNSASSRTKRLSIEPSLYILQSPQSLQILPHQTLPDESMPACIRNWRGTYARIRRTGDGVGALKFRLKCRSVEKHVRLRRCRCGSSPRGNVLVERRSGMKHISHISHLRCVPTPNVLVERRSVRNIPFISVTFAVFQLPMSWLNAEAEETYYP